MCIRDSNKQGLEELASVMGGRLNFTLDQAQHFDLSSIPDATADELDTDEFDEDPEAAMDLDAEDDVETKPQSEA